MNQLAQKLEAWIAILITVAVTACGNGDESEGFDATVGLSTPNKFLTFFNRQGDLSAGDYTLVAATNGEGQAGTFSVNITRNDGSATQVINGSWFSSGGLDPDPTCASGNRCYNIDLQDASGASFTLTTALDGVLYLVDDSDTPQVVATANASSAGAAETFDFSESEIDETDFASAYYATIDPMDARTTAQDYIALHGLDNPDVHVIFRDAKDLGYGRDMYMRSYANPSACGGQIIVFYVRNFLVEVVEGFAYGPVNLEAAIAEDLQYHVSTNAIEFGKGRADVGDTCSNEPMARFYSYQPIYNPANSTHPRRARVNLDGRGEKAMPQPCITCHGGKLRPRDRNGGFVAIHAEDPVNQIGDTKARMQAFEVNNLEFSEQSGHRRVDYEEGLRLLNLAAFCTYPESDTHVGCTAHGGGLPEQTNDGEWNGDFAREMMLGWYGDDGVNNALSTAGSRFSSSFIPPGWTAMSGVPVGAEVLFTKVVGPNCIVCHDKRGTQRNSAPDFSTWNKFDSYADEIEHLVFDEGRMPLGLVGYDNFWGDPEKAELLASIIEPSVSDPSEFQARRRNSNGKLIPPGRIIARAGPGRVTKPNEAITLNAQASLFADTFRWSLISAPAGGEDAVISSPGNTRTDFSADTDGTYVLRLTASTSADGTQKSDDITIEVTSALAKAPRALTFYDDIKEVFKPSSGSNCTDSCHMKVLNPDFNLHPPVWWTEAQPPVTSQVGLYEQARARVNLEFIEDSLILKKPSGNHHTGNRRPGFDTSKVVGASEREDYDMFVNWIAEGAPCGGSAAQCP